MASIELNRVAKSYGIILSCTVSISLLPMASSWFSSAPPDAANPRCCV